MKKVTWPDRPQVQSVDDRDHRLRAVHRCGDCAARRDLQALLVRLPSFFWAANPAAMLEHRWYAIQTTSGHENKVQRLIQRKIDMDPAHAGGAADPSGARADAGSGGDQERQEGHRRTEDLPGLRARGHGGQPGHARTRSTPSRASSSSSARTRSRCRCATTKSIVCSGSRGCGRRGARAARRFRSSSVRRSRSPKDRSPISMARSKK